MHCTALHHWTMSLHATISLNSGFRSMPLPDEIAVRLPPPSASVTHCTYMQGCVYTFEVQACLRA